MKKLFLAAVAAGALACSGLASAADLPTKAAPPIVPAAYDWTGIYFGAHIGAGWDQQRFSDPVGFTAMNGLFSPPAFTSGPLGQNVNKTSFLGGGQVGANYQIGRLVIGSEFDASWTNLKTTNTGAFVLSPIAPVPGIIGTESFNSKTDWVATATTRIGLARDTWLLYGKAGAAFTRSNNNALLTASAPGFAAATLAGRSGDSNRVGWTVGTGVEWAFARNWTGKIEYDYIDFGTKVQNIAAVGTTGEIAAGGPFPFAANLPVSVHQSLSMVKAGINYKFDQGFLFW
jgi:outer membrane immunogenic protein